MENLRNRRSRFDFAQATFNSYIIFQERSNSELLLNRPIYSGLCVLKMLNFHYGYIKEKYPNERSRQLLTDTDSLIYNTENLYQEILEDHHLFDFSRYPKDDPCFSNEKGYRKNEG